MARSEAEPNEGKAMDIKPGEITDILKREIREYDR